jgi:hypothetical protein
MAEITSEQAEAGYRLAVAMAREALRGDDQAVIRLLGTAPSPTVVVVALAHLAGSVGRAVARAAGADVDMESVLTGMLAALAVGPDRVN